MAPLEMSGSALCASARRAAFNHLINIKGRWAGPGVVVKEDVVVMGFCGRSWTEESFGDVGSDWRGAQFDCW